jgi:hypothetical protein
MLMRVLRHHSFGSNGGPEIPGPNLLPPRVELTRLIALALVVPHFFRTHERRPAGKSQRREEWSAIVWAPRLGKQHVMQRLD